MKQWKRIITAVLVVMLMTVTGLAVWQKDNLKALYVMLTQDAQSISQDMEKKQQAQKEKLEQDFNITIQAPSAEQNTDLLDGNLTPEEVKEALGLVQPPVKDDFQSETPPEVRPAEPTPSVQQAPEPHPPTPEPPSPEEPKQLTEEERKAQIEELVNQCVTEMYAYEVDLMAEMGEMKKIALKDWNSRPSREKTKEKTIEFGFMWLNEVYKVEARADRNVKDILNRYRASLEDLRADVSVLDDMWKYYCDKKSDTKAYYLNKYLN